MLRLALADNEWVKLSTWDAEQPDWVRTVDALAYGDNVELMLLCGGDLLETFAMPVTVRYG